MSTTQKLLQNPGALCNMVRRVAVGAGHLALDYFESGEGLIVEKKEDGSPVTTADRAAEDFIEKALKEIAPEILMVGEEASALGHAPNIAGHEYFWLVDPLDATKEYIAGGSDYTVNIALIRGTSPVLGVVYAPARKVLYAGFGPETAVRWSEETGKEKSISVRKTPAGGLTVMGSLRHNDHAKFNRFVESYKIEKIVKRASSLKICNVAEGKADMYPRLGPTGEWDTAAGEAVLCAAGGVLTDMHGHPLVYGGAAKEFRNPEFVACAFEWFNVLQDDDV